METLISTQILIVKGIAYENELTNSGTTFIQIKKSNGTLTLITQI